MLLRTRVTLIVTVTYTLLVAGLTFAGLKSEELADERYADATLNGQQIFWEKLVENTIQRLEAALPAVLANRQVVEAAATHSPSKVRDAMAATVAALAQKGAVSHYEISAADGELLYSSRSLLDAALVDSGNVRLIAESAKPRTAILQDGDGRFLVAMSLPLSAADGAVVAIATLAADLRPPLTEFKASTGADVFLVDRKGRMSDGTDATLWQVFKDRLAVRRSRLETWPDGDRFYSVVVFPLNDGQERVIGALVSVRDSTETQSRQRQIRIIAIGSVAGFLVLVLGVFSLYLRRSFNPLDQAINVLNALSRGDTSVSLDVSNENDEIGRIASTVGVFRENAIKLDLLEARRERQRRRQELFIRLQMLRLSEMLELEARQAVLDDLRQIEALSSRPRDDGGPTDGGKGELDVLAVAFQTMSSRIRDQHQSLETLIAERTRDVEILREALRTRDQLALLRQELDFARELQLSSLPQVFPPFPDRTEFKVHAAMVPAKEVGGDFYDFFLIDRHHLAVVIGDASGKGVPAAMFIAITRSLVKAVAPLSASPGECLAFVNTMLSGDNPQTLFATCFYGVLDTRTGEISFCNAGHPPPMIVRANGRVEAIRDVSGVALGVMEGLDYETGTFVLAPGDLLHLYTDGVTEAQDNRDRLYEEAGLMTELGSTPSPDPEETIGRVFKSVEDFVGLAPQFDDITMLSLRFDHPSEAGEPTAAPPPVLRGIVRPVLPQPGHAEPQPSPPVMEATIRNHVDELAGLADKVDAFVSGLGLPEKIAFNLNVCLDELITNIISYGYDDEASHDIVVRVSFDGTELRTEITDDAKEYDPFTEAPAPDLNLGVEDRPVGGLGVFLVKEFMDATSYRHEAGYNTTTLRKSVGQHEGQC